MVRFGLDAGHDCRGRTLDHVAKARRGGARTLCTGLHLRQQGLRKVCPRRSVNSPHFGDISRGYRARQSVFRLQKEAFGCHLCEPLHVPDHELGDRFGLHRPRVPVFLGLALPSPKQLPALRHYIAYSRATPSGASQGVWLSHTYRCIGELNEFPRTAHSRTVKALHPTEKVTLPLGVDYPTAWARRGWARAIRHVALSAIITPWTKWSTTLSVEGEENIPAEGPVIFAPNHTSHLDTPVMLAAIGPRRATTVVAAAADTFYQSARKARWTTLLFNTIPIERHRINRKSAEQAVELVREGWSIVIYPEGGRTPTGQLREFKGGAAFMAEKTGAAVVPVFIHGIGSWRSEQAKAPVFTSQPSRRRSHVSVTFGPAVRSTDDTNVRRLNAHIEQAVVELARRVTRQPLLEIERD